MSTHENPNLTQTASTLPYSAPSSPPQLVEDMAEADVIVYLPESAPWHKTGTYSARHMNSHYVCHLIYHM